MSNNESDGHLALRIDESEGSYSVDIGFEGDGRLFVLGVQTLLEAMLQEYPESKHSVEAILATLHENFGSFEQFRLN